MNITKADLRKANQWAKDEIDGVSIPGRYGKLTYNIEDGKITLIRDEKTKKPPEEKTFKP